VALDRASTPFRPFEQLLSVFPAASAHALPSAMAKLMVEPDSPLADFYPQSFGLDLNGKRYLWQGVVLLPFIDEHRLLRCAKQTESTLTDEEKERNSHGCEYVFFSARHPMRNAAAKLDSRLVANNVAAPVTAAQVRTSSHRYLHFV